MINRHLLLVAFSTQKVRKYQKGRKRWPFDQVVKMDIQFFYFTKKAKGKSLRRRVTLPYYSYPMYKGDKEKDLAYFCPDFSLQKKLHRVNLFKV